MFTTARSRKQLLIALAVVVSSVVLGVWTVANIMWLMQGVPSLFNTKASIWIVASILIEAALLYVILVIIVGHLVIKITHPIVRWLKNGK